MEQAHDTRAAEPSWIWDVGRPQRAIYELEVAGELGHEVLDLGCGAGEHALFLASRGHLVCGVDSSAAPIARAERRAREAGLTVSFVVEDLLRLDRLGRRFDAVVDAGTFHRIAIESRPRYAAGLQSVLRPGGRLFLLCFGDHQRGHGGPARVSQAALRSLFAEGWQIEAIDDVRLESHSFPGGANAWRLRACRT